MSRILLTLLALLFLPSNALAQLPGPNLTLRDSVVLQEDDDNYVSHPIQVAVGPNNSFLISDGPAEAVLEFDSNGRFMRSFGRPGRGPGEFRGIAGFSANSEVVVAVDEAGMELEVFDYASGESIGAVDIPPTMFLTYPSQQGDSIWFFGMDQSSWMSVGAVAHAELVRMASQPGGASGEPLRLDRVTVPQPYQLSRHMFSSYGATVADIGPSDAVVGFLATTYLLVVDGSRVDTLHLMPRERLGMPSEQELRDREYRLDRTEPTSWLMSLSRDQAGNILLVHADMTVEEGNPSTGGGFRFSGFEFHVSSLSPDGARQCADTFVPLSDVGWPRATLIGSELMIVDQVAQSATLVATVIRRYEVDASTCDGEVR